jgi:hypothetical protein
MQRLCFGMGEDSHAMKPGSSISEVRAILFKKAVVTRNAARLSL